MHPPPQDKLLETVIRVLILIQNTEVTDKAISQKVRLLGCVCKESVSCSTTDLNHLQNKYLQRGNKAQRCLLFKLQRTLLTGMVTDVLQAYRTPAAQFSALHSDGCPITPLQDILPPNTPYLHPVWASAAKQQPSLLSFLVKYLRLPVAPSPIHPASTPSLPPELLHVVRSGSTPQKAAMLNMLRNRWTASGFKDAVHKSSSSSSLKQQLSSMEVEAITPSGPACLPLSQTYLPTEPMQTLLGIDLPFLKVPDPESPAWRFLAALGVSCTPSVPSVLKRLGQLSTGSVVDGKSVDSLYWFLGQQQQPQQQQIKAAFQEAPLVLHKVGKKGL